MSHNYPSPNETMRLKLLGWQRTGIHLPPEVRAFVEAECAWRKQRMSTFIWHLLAAVFLKAHGCGGGELPSLREVIAQDKELRDQGHKWIGVLLEAAAPEARRVYEETHIYSAERLDGSTK